MIYYYHLKYKRDYYSVDFLDCGSVAGSVYKISVLLISSLASGCTGELLRHFSNILWTKFLIINKKYHAIANNVMKIIHMPSSSVPVLEFVKHKSEKLTTTITNSPTISIQFTKPLVYGRVATSQIRCHTLVIPLKASEIDGGETKTTIAHRKARRSTNISVAFILKLSGSSRRSLVSSAHFLYDS